MMYHSTPSLRGQHNKCYSAALDIRSKIEFVGLVHPGVRRPRARTFVHQEVDDGEHDQYDHNQSGDGDADDGTDC